MLVWWCNVESIATSTAHGETIARGGWITSISTFLLGTSNGLNVLRDELFGHVQRKSSNINVQRWAIIIHINLWQGCVDDVVDDEVILMRTRGIALL